MIEQWTELKETIIEMRDSNGKGTQKDVCEFLVKLMGVLEKQMDAEPISQIKWERDIAIAQLQELGYGLGEKPKKGKENKA